MFEIFVRFGRCVCYLLSRFVNNSIRGNYMVQFFCHGPDKKSNAPHPALPLHKQSESTKKMQKKHRMLFGVNANRGHQQSKNKRAQHNHTLSEENSMWRHRWMDGWMDGWRENSGGNTQGLGPIAPFSRSP